MSVIGIDLGGTKVAAALFSASGEILARDDAQLAGRDGSAVGALVTGAALRLLDASSDAVTAVGVAVPGIFRSGSGTVWAPNIPGWDDYPLAEELAGALGGDVPVRIDSDRACGILGESWRGAAQGCRDAVFLVVGTGIGAGILVDGRVLRGHGDIAGAIGWLALSRPYQPAYVGVGCFEHHASGTGLATVARQRLSAEAGYAGSLRGLNAALAAPHVFAAYEAGDAVATSVLDDAVAYWGMAVANLVSLLNPEIILFGGGVFGPAARFLDRIRAEAARWAQPIAMTQVRLALAALGSEAVLYGAGRLALDPANVV